MRLIHQGDALAWLERQPVLENSSFVTSLPDFTEFPGQTLEQWGDWWKRAAGLIFARCPDNGVAIFYQRDSKIDGRWVDKGYLTQRAAEIAGAPLLWHKIVARTPPGNVTFGKPGYSHLLCFSRGVRLGLEYATTDLLPRAGARTWARGMGEDVCRVACRFILEHTTTRTVVDPFCGEGSVLAVANTLGLEAVGVELSRKRAERAEALTYPFPERAKA